MLRPEDDPIDSEQFEKLPSSLRKAYLTMEINEDKLQRKLINLRYKKASFIKPLRYQQSDEIKKAYEVSYKSPLLCTKTSKVLVNQRKHRFPGLSMVKIKNSMRQSLSKEDPKSSFQYSSDQIGKNISYNTLARKLTFSLKGNTTNIGKEKNLFMKREIGKSQS